MNISRLVAIIKDYAKINLETLHNGFYFRHVLDKHQVKNYEHRIKSRGITNFHSSPRFCLGIPCLAVVVRPLLMHR